MDASAGSSGGTLGDGDGDGDVQDESSSSSSLPSKSKTHSSKALEEFRNEWKREMEKSPQHVVPKPVSKTTVTLNIEDKAKVYFQMGVEYEEKGKMYEAIQFYRKAVQLVPDVEFKLFQVSAPVVTQKSPDGQGVVEEEEGDLSDDDVSEDVPYDSTKVDLLTHLNILRLKQQTRSLCSQQRHQNATHISSLPMEIFLSILRWVVSSDLDFRSLEMCARVCRGFYVCCRDSEIWRTACSRVWGLKCGALGGRYPTWRDMFIKRPRPHYSGCYISYTTYVRPGEDNFQDDAYRPWHLVEYYRYLRFFPDGRVLMLTTPEEPITCVNLMRQRQPPPRRPPFFSGFYRLHKNTVSIVVSPDTEKTSSQRSNSNQSYPNTFHLELEILSHKKQLHGQLVWRGYSVFSKMNGVESNVPFALTPGRFPPFWYSRVKSYTSESHSPLV